MHAWLSLRRVQPIVSASEQQSFLSWQDTSHEQGLVPKTLQIP